MLITSRHVSHKKAGLTLIEVLVALGIIAITMVMFGYFSTSLRATGDSRRNTAAANFARSYLDSVRSQWQDVEIYKGGHKTRPNPPFLDVPEGFESYSVSVEARNVNNVVVGTRGPYTSTAGAAAFNLENGGDNDFMRLVTLTLTDTQGETYTYSTQVVRPPTED
jgi:prepilin-type N-terminal cleavage/methylation domain-containing protein